MRILFVLVIFALLFGCSANSVTQDKINITLSDFNQTEIFDNSINNTVNTISFIMKNNEAFPVDCSVIISMTNTTNSSSNERYIGVLQPGYRKNVSLHFVMFFGNTSLSIKPDCKELV